MRINKSIALCLMAITSTVSAEEHKLGYFSAPSIHDQSIVFTAEGDLWHSNVDAGIAKRLTTHESLETMASISPDGKQVAYVANYAGTYEAYLMPINGGTPKRLTYENSRVRVQGWTQNGDVLYATDSGFGPANYWTLKTVTPGTLKVNKLPLADAIEGSVSRDGKYLFFTRFGLQVTGDNSRVYRGGAQGQIWRWRLGSSQEAKPLTQDHQASVREPMVYKNKVVFISDQSGSANLWSMDFDGANKTQLTFHQDWEIRLASNHQNQVVYQLGADIHQLDLDTNKSTVLDISLTSDFAQRQERWLNTPMNYFNDAAIAGNGKRVVITARGKLAVGGLNNTRLSEISTPEQSRTRSAVLSNDGKYVYAINDTSGEQEIWRFATSGGDKGQQLTQDGNTFRWNLYPSPDGQYLAHDDRDGNLWLLDLQTRKNTKIADQGVGFSGFDSIVWSPDSKLIAIAGAHSERQRSSIRLYSLERNQEQFIGSDKYEDFSPAFTRDGNWIYFISQRHFASNPRSPWGDRNMGPAFDKRGLVFAYPLNKEAKFAFAKPNELNEVSNNQTEDEQSKSKNKPELNWQGITDTLYQAPIKNGNYSALASSDSGLYLLESNAGKRDIQFVKFDQIEPKVETFIKDVVGFQLADNGKQLAVVKKAGKTNDIFITDATATAPKNLNKAKVNSNQWQVSFAPIDEWQQLFQDAWLMHREFLFDSNMRGLDWQATKQKYQPLVNRITSRDELNDIFAQMMGELNALHSQVRGGDMPINKDAAKGSVLGGRFLEVNDGIQIDAIYQTDPELPALASPLAKAEVNAQVGDIITHINNNSVATLVDMHKALRNKAGKQVLLTIKRDKTSHQTVIIPGSTRQDASLRYLDWVDHNQKIVAKAGDDIGYLHMNAMTSNDINHFAREFYANFDKDALIIDVRRNRGGNIDSWLIEKLLRQAWMFWQERDNTPTTNMQQTFRGHLVVLTDQLTYSDGETFAAAIKSLGLAPLIGKQTSGAGVWLTGRNRLSDNGMARVAELPQYSLQGEWVVEGTGVSPDIDVDNLPYATFTGTDAQLQAGIEYLKEKMKQQPVKKLKAKPMPKSGPAADIQKHAAN
ncbi:peptidase S41 [Thalassotalea litorea]|uniref:Tricorn protease homolog n=1 Tax=Thalassotalea litorea TaxID=2020715 RepID=A0A5R9IH84_9GAMM|nr:S41 family peptidase [Thalassotalea litorea]TLU64890.1 peptidase S41 [Thalassotalea litorea]